MQARLFCKTGSFSGSSFVFGEQATIGKGPGNTVQLTAGAISGSHARIYFDQQRKAYFVEDLKSRNGTWVDGVRVAGKERLDRLNVISFAGSFDFIFQVVDLVADAPAARAASAPGKGQATSGTVLDSEPIVFSGVPIVKATPVSASDARVGKVQSPPLNQEKKSAPAGGAATQFDDQSGTPPVLPSQSSQQVGSEAKRPSRKVYIIEIQISGAGPQRFTLKDGESVVGRDSSCDIVVKDTSISRRHAVITVGPEAVTVKDLASKNHTMVDNKVIETEVSLVNGSEVCFGSVKARLQEKS